MHYRFARIAIRDNRFWRLRSCAAKRCIATVVLRSGGPMLRVVDAAGRPAVRLHRMRALAVLAGGV